MYKVIKKFTDVTDGHVYNVGDTFPRDGVTVSDARLKKLASNTNRQKEPLIAEVNLVPAIPAQSERVEQDTPYEIVDEKVDEVKEEVADKITDEVEVVKPKRNRKTKKD